MAKCAVYNIGGQRAAVVEFSPKPPDTDAIVYSASRERIGSIKARHEVGEGTVYDAQGNVVGTVFGNAVIDDVPCMAVDNKNATLGGVVNAHQVMLGTSPDRWSLVGTVQTDSWTAIDDQGLADTMRAIGKGDPENLYTFVKIIQVKQRVLTGVAALLLRQLGAGMETKVSVSPAGDTITPASSYTPVHRSESKYSTGCLVLAFLVFPWLWAILILSEKEAHDTWVQVVAWIVLALAALWLLSLFVQ